MMQKFPMYAYIPAKDMARARRFYEAKPGFKPGPRVGDGVKFEDYGELPDMQRKDSEGNIMALI